MVLILFPPFDFKVQYQSDKKGESTKRPIHLLGPTVLPQSSALILDSGDMKFQMIQFECRATRQDEDVEVDG